MWMARNQYVLLCHSKVEPEHYSSTIILECLYHMCNVYLVTLPSLLSYTLSMFTCFVSSKHIIFLRFMKKSMQEKSSRKKVPISKIIWKNIIIYLPIIIFIINNIILCYTDIVLFHKLHKKKLHTYILYRYI